MRAIIIQDTDARALLDKLRLQSMQSENVMRFDPNQPARVEDVHRAFHYIVVKWFQEQGADVIGR